MSQEDNRARGPGLMPQQLLSRFYPHLLTTLPNIYSAILQANKLLFTKQDITYCSVCEGSSKKHITQVDCLHHGHTFVRDSHPTVICPYPSNITIQCCSILPGARDTGIHNLKGMDGVWVGAIIADKAQVCCLNYPGTGVL